MKFTALEIVTLTGIEQPSEQFGKFGIEVGGVLTPKPDHIVNLQDAKTVHVRIGRQHFDVDVPAQDSHSAAVEAALKTKGEASTEAFNASQIAKGRMEAPATE